MVADKKSLPNLSANIPPNPKNAAIARGFAKLDMVSHNSWEVAKLSIPRNSMIHLLNGKWIQEIDIKRTKVRPINPLQSNKSAVKKLTVEATPFLPLIRPILHSKPVRQKERLSKNVNESKQQSDSPPHSLGDFSDIKWSLDAIKNILEQDELPKISTTTMNKKSVLPIIPQKSPTKKKPKVTKPALEVTDSLLDDEIKVEFESNLLGPAEMLNTKVKKRPFARTVDRILVSWKWAIYSVIYMNRSKYLNYSTSQKLIYLKMKDSESQINAPITKSHVEASHYLSKYLERSKEKSNSMDLEALKGHLSRYELFSNVPVYMYVKLLELCELKTLSKNQIIFQAGTNVQAVYLILVGECMESSQSNDRLLSGGKCSIISKWPILHTSTWVTTMMTELLVIEYGVWKKFTENCELIMESQLDLLRQIPIFNELSTDCLDLIARRHYCQILSLEKFTALDSQALEKCNYYIISGQALIQESRRFVRKKGADNKEAIPYQNVSTLGENDEIFWDNVTLCTLQNGSLTPKVSSKRTTLFFSKDSRAISIPREIQRDLPEFAIKKLEYDSDCFLSANKIQH